LKEFNKEKMQGYDFHYSLQRNYGMTIADYQVQLSKQENRCAICRQEEKYKYKGITKNLSVDHCHETGKNRGLLCQRCNFAIGQFEDSWLLLNNAQEYLAYWHCKHGSSKVKSWQEVPFIE